MITPLINISNPLEIGWLGLPDSNFFLFSVSIPYCNCYSPLALIITYCVFFKVQTRVSPKVLGEVSWCECEILLGSLYCVRLMHERQTSSGAPARAECVRFAVCVCRGDNGAVTVKKSSPHSWRVRRGSPVGSVAAAARPHLLSRPERAQYRYAHPTAPDPSPALGTVCECGLLHLTCWQSPSQSILHAAERIGPIHVHVRPNFMSLVARARRPVLTLHAATPCYALH